MRDSRVFIKMLGGLEPVDVIFRRASTTAFCDPLELRGDSTLGVPGLVEAVRSDRSSSPTRSAGPGRDRRHPAVLRDSAGTSSVKT